MEKEVYKLTYPSSSQATVSTWFAAAPKTPSSKLEQWKANCVNKDDLGDTPDHLLVYYKEGDKIYCLPIHWVIEVMASSETPRNPYTDQPFSDKFITSFSNKYDLGLKTRGYEGVGDPTFKFGNETPLDFKFGCGPLPPPSPFEPDPGLDPGLAPGLVEMIGATIAKCEEALFGEPPGKSPSEPPGKSPSESPGGSIRGLSQHKSYDEDDDDCSTSDDDSSTECSDQEDDVSDSSSRSGSSDHDPLIPKSTGTGPSCPVCNKDINQQKSFKTQIIDTKSATGFSPIHFCSLDCMDHPDQKWPNIKKASKSQHSDSKKYGRNGAKERQKKDDGKKDDGKKDDGKK